MSFPDFREVPESRNEREKQLATGVATPLVFMPDESRDIRKLFDVSRGLRGSLRQILLILFAAAICCSCDGALESAGGTHADAVWMGWCTASH